MDICNFVSGVSRTETQDNATEGSIFSNGITIKFSLHTPSPNGYVGGYDDSYLKLE